MAPLRAVGQVLPPTYAANAFRAAVQSLGPEAFAWDLLVLAGFSVASLVLVAYGTRWRTE